MGASAAPHNLAAPLTSFIGRSREMAQVQTLLSSTRLLTLVGAGGIGKTRLALEVAASLVGDYPDGVWLVELAPLADGSLVAQAVASVLGVQEEPGQPLERTLAHSLRNQQLLLVIDNCEHVVDACARLVVGLLRAAPGLRILATSRAGLEVEGEVTWSVPPLSLPDPPSHLAGDTDRWLEGAEAARLFVARATAAQPAFRLRDADVDTVAAVCRRLDGMPLAIELAAARIKIMGLDQIASRLADRFHLLTGASRTAPARHQSLRAAIEWSYGLLVEPERALFDRLGVFAGGWTLEAAEGVGAEAEQAADVLELLARLVEKSLVVVEPAADGSGNVRHRLLETLRAFALEQLAARGEVELTRARHARFFLELVERAAGEVARSEQGAWLQRLDAERDNVRAALEWAVDRNDGETALRLGAALWRYWERRGDFSEGRVWLQRALEHGSNAIPALHAACLHGAGHLAWRQRDLEQSERLHRSALDLSRTEGDEAGVARAVYGLARVAGSRGDYVAALAHAEESLRIQRRLGNHNDVALVLNVMGEIARASGDYMRAGVLYEESLALFRQTGEVLGIQIELHNLGFVASRQGDWARAARLFAESLDLSRQFGIRMGIASCLGGLAGCAVVGGAPRVAAQLFGAAEALREAIAFPMEVVDRAELDRDIASLHAALDRGAVEIAWAEGRALAVDATIELGLSVANSHAHDTRSHSTTVVRLTAREQAVAGLIAQGLTNRQIADALVISKPTADRHVSNILSKLGMATRAQVASWVAERRHLT